MRPEAVRLGAEGVPAQVAAVEYLGADTLVETRVAGESVIVRLSGRTATAPGNTVHLSWDPAAAHWFTLSTGRRIER